ncbi:hypothetical protein [Streptomyces sp. NPDC048192]|uniref:hypothetical protein n=1 Tax=Streptomyces sp. NPDC048192 TaxID=3365510 RepID=UPI00371951DD
MAGNEEEESARDLPEKSAEPEGPGRRTERIALISYVLSTLYYGAHITYVVWPWFTHQLFWLVKTYM